jgi:hypothetical protein
MNDAATTTWKYNYYLPFNETKTIILPNEHISSALEIHKNYHYFEARLNKK